MDWIWIFTTITILFLVLIAFRLIYIRGFKAGARRVLNEWKQSLKEEEDSNARDF